MSLKFIVLSGTTGVTQNCYVYESDRDMIVVDCGVGFPDQEMFGVDLIIPDLSYIRENKKKLRGILISHGHEDHIGALPFLLKEVNAPVYGTALVAGFLKDKFSDYGLKGKKINVFDPDKDTFKLGDFKITPFRVTHSVPDSVGYAIDTPEGRVFHVAEYKFDRTPVVGHTVDIEKIKSLSSQGPLFIASDCLGSNKPGFTMSEKQIERRIEIIAREAKGAIFFTTISSNISRIQQALNVAGRLGRKATFVGRSTEKKAIIAKELGYLNYKKGLVIFPKELTKLAKEKRLYIISGSYGQPGSSLYRAALGEHRLITIEKGDTIIFSSDPGPPGSKQSIDFIVDRLIELDSDVHYYDMQEDLHVSGHGSQEDIKKLLSLVKPKYFIPIGGTIRFMRAYRDLVVGTGADSDAIFELKPGESVELKNRVARRGKRVKSKEVLVDGLGIGDVGNVVLRDRKILANEGVAIAMIQIDGAKHRLTNDPEIISRGFVFEKKKKGLLVKAGRELGKRISKRKRIDKRTSKYTAIDFLERFFYKETGRRPMILPVIVEV
ncbi:MAG: ribonuclease J [Patescibacteria group bacterium]